MTQAVIYTRVSSTSQVKKGDGLASQESRCREFAAYKGYSVTEVFQDRGVSGGLVDRPAMKDMLSWLRKHRTAEPVVIIDDISRLARDLDAHLRLDAGTTAPQKRASFDDFPLRGHVACASCGHPMTGYWAKGRSKRYAYYECFQKGCDARRKSIKRAEVEEAFETLLRALRPSRGLMAIASAMFRDIWDTRSKTHSAHKKAQKDALRKLEADITRAADRLISTDSTAAARALESDSKLFEGIHCLASMLFGFSWDDRGDHHHVDHRGEHDLSGEADADHPHDDH